MYRFLAKNEKLAFVNLEDPIQIEKSAGIKSFSFGVNNNLADIKIKSIKANPFVVIEYDDFDVKSHLIGLYNANNINASVAMGYYFKVDKNDIKEAIENYIPENNRSQLLKKGSNQIILDAYNANPSSMAVAIANFLQLESVNKIMILGDMFELGDESVQEHKLIVDSLLHQDKSKCYLIGKFFYGHKVVAETVEFFETFDSFVAYLKTIQFNGNTILIKEKYL